MKKITLLFAMFSIMIGNSQNLITNGDFSNGATGWVLDGGGTVTNGEATFATTNAGGNPWDTQLAQNGFAFTNATTYTLTFKARAASNRNITVAIQNPGPWTNQVPNQVYALTTAMQTFTQTVLASSTSANVNLAFLLANQGGSTAAVYIDDVSLTGPAAPPTQQVLITNFETAPFVPAWLASWDGAAVSNGNDPQSGGTRGMNMQMVVTASAGQIWQGCKVTLPNDNLMNLTTDKTVKVDVYSMTPMTIMGKVESGSGATPVENDQNHAGNGWQTITYTFAAANGNYNTFAVFANRNGSGGFNNPVVGSTTYFDNLTAVKYVAPADPAPTTSAPNPTHGNADVVMSMFNDKPGFTNVYVPEGEFGTRALINLDAENDQTTKMNFGVAGWGQYDNTPPSVATANFLHLDYYVPTFAAGANGHGFWIMLNSGSGERQYRIGNGNTPGSGNQAIVFDTWTTVSIPMSHFIGLGFNPATLVSWKLGSDSDLNTRFVYFDNIYFTVNALNNDNFTKNTVSIYPNPVQDLLTINTQDTLKSVTVFNINGQQMPIRLNNNTIDVSSFSNGVYMLSVELENGSKEVMKFVK